MLRAGDRGGLCGLARSRSGTIALSHIQLEDCDDTEGWARFAAIASSGGWCLFVSELEVHSFVDALLRNGLDLRSFGKLKIVAFGPRSKMLFSGKEFERTCRCPAWKKLSRANLNRDEDSNPPNLVIASNKMEIEPSEWAEIIELKLFARKPASWEPHWTHEVRNNPPDFILFRNPAAVDGYVKILGPSIAHCIAQNSRIIATDEATAMEAMRCNLPCIVDVEFLRSSISKQHP